MSIDPKLRWKLRILHIRDAIEYIMEYTNGKDFESFTNDRLTFDATARNFQIIGEAVKKIPEEITDKYPDIPWKDMARFRDKIVHDYDGVNHRVLWDVIQNKLPQLLEDIKKMPVKEEDFE